MGLDGPRIDDQQRLDQSWKALNDTASMKERRLGLWIGCLNGSLDLRDVHGALSANGARVTNFLRVTGSIPMQRIVTMTSRLRSCLQINFFGSNLLSSMMRLAIKSGLVTVGLAISVSLRQRCPSRDDG